MRVSASSSWLEQLSKNIDHSVDSKQPVIFATAAVLAFVLLRNSRFHFYTQREATPTKKSARKWRCDLSRLHARKITKGIHSCKPASMNRLIVPASMCPYLSMSLCPCVPIPICPCVPIPMCPCVPIRIIMSPCPCVPIHICPNVHVFLSLYVPVSMCSYPYMSPCPCVPILICPRIHVFLSLYVPVFMCSYPYMSPCHQWLSYKHPFFLHTCQHTRVPFSMCLFLSV